MKFTAVYFDLMIYLHYTQTVPHGLLKIADCFLYLWLSQFIYKLLKNGSALTYKARAVQQLTGTLENHCADVSGQKKIRTKIGIRTILCSTFVNPT